MLVWLLFEIFIYLLVLYSFICFLPTDGSSRDSWKRINGVRRVKTSSAGANWSWVQFVPIKVELGKTPGPVEACAVPST